MLRRMRTAARTLLCFGLMVLLLIGLGTLCITQMADIRRNGQIIELNAMPRQALADELGLNLARLRTLALQTYAFTTEEDQDYITTRRSELSAAVDHNLDTYEKTATLVEETQALSGLRFTYQNYLTGIEQVDASVKNREPETALASLIALRSLAAFMDDQTRVLALLSKQEAGRAGEDGAAAYSRARWIAVLAIALATCACLILAWRFSRSILRPLQDAVECAQRIANDDLTGTIDSNGEDEAAHLLQALALMQANLRSTLGQMQGAAHQLARAAQGMTKPCLQARKA